MNNTILVTFCKCPQKLGGLKDLLSCSFCVSEFQAWIHEVPLLQGLSWGWSTIQGCSVIWRLAGMGAGRGKGKLSTSKLTHVVTGKPQSLSSWALNGIALQHPPSEQFKRETKTAATIWPQEWAPTQGQLHGHMTCEVSQGPGLRRALHLD